MNLTKTSKHNWIYTVLAFLLPFLGITTVLFFKDCQPFGKLALLFSDAFHQYYPFFKDFREALLSGDSLLFNWSVGMGVDYLGLCSYYLASPLNLFSVFVPEQHLIGYYSMLMPIKLGLASMFFAIFLQKVFNKHDYSIPLFASFYGTCAWSMGYFFNIMWLDTFALLPLVMVGMLSLLRDKKFILYTVTLFFSIAINYYIGLFTCFFVFLCFFCYEICRFKDWQTTCRDFIRIGVFSVIAIAMTAVITLPALAALQTTQSSVNAFPQGFQLNMTYNKTIWGLLEAMSKVAGNMNGGITPTLVEGLPNVYCGVFATVFGFLYLFCKEIRLRDKLCAAGMILFINLSFIIRQLDYIWHGFHFTNMIPYRFSFLYSFVLLYMAYAAWVNRKSFSTWQVALAAIAGGGIIFCYNDLNDKAFLAYNCAMLLLYIAALAYHSFTPKTDDAAKEKNSNERTASTWKDKLPKVDTKRLCSAVLLCVILGELVLNLVNFSSSYTPLTTVGYPQGMEPLADTVEHMKETNKDSDFYRAEVTHSQTLNEGALIGYNGVTTFTSSANVKVTEFMVALGYAAKNTYNRYCFEESSPVANLFLNLKYMIERSGKVKANSYFDDVYNSGNVHLLENNAYLPLGFLAENQLVDFDFSGNSDKFQFQNRLMQMATAIPGDVWHTIPGNLLTITGNGPNITPQPATGYCSYDAATNTGTVVYSYTADRNGLVCVYIDQSQRNNFSLSHNGVNLLSSEAYSLPQMASVCTVKAGDVVEVRFHCDSKVSGNIKVNAAILNETLFRQCYDKLAESTLDLTSFSNTEVTGTINCNRDGVLYTSIPQNGNWHAIVDGKPAETVLIGDAMVGVKLPVGSHTVSFVYKNNAYTLGLIVSILAALSLAGAAVVMYNPKFFRKKEQ